MAAKCQGCGGSCVPAGTPPNPNLLSTLFGQGPKCPAGQEATWPKGPLGQMVCKPAIPCPAGFTKIGVDDATGQPRCLDSATMPCPSAGPKGPCPKGKEYVRIPGRPADRCFGYPTICCPIGRKALPDGTCETGAAPADLTKSTPDTTKPSKAGLLGPNTTSIVIVGLVGFMAWWVWRGYGQEHKVNPFVAKR